jgi:hypothetical protein
VKALKTIGYWLSRIIITATCISPTFDKSPPVIIAAALVVFILVHVLLNIAFAPIPGDDF